MKRKKNNKSDAYASKFTNEQLGFIIFRLCVMLDDHIDAILIAAEDDGFLTPERAAQFGKTQHDARFLAECFAPLGDAGVLP